MKRNCGEIIRQVREERGISVKACASLCALAPEEYTKMENGERAFDHSELVLLSNAFGISVSALEEGRLVYKKDLPDLEELVNKLLEKLEELERGIIRIRAVIDETFSKEHSEVKENEISEENAARVVEETEAIPETENPEIEEERSEELCLK